MWLLLKEEVFSQEVSAVTASVVIFLEDYFLNLNPHQNGPSDPTQNGGVRSFPGPKQSRASPRQEDRTQSPHHRPCVTRALPEFPALLATPYLWLLSQPPCSTSEISLLLLPRLVPSHC